MKFIRLVIVIFILLALGADWPGGSFPAGPSRVQAQDPPPDPRPQIKLRGHRFDPLATPHGAAPAPAFQPSSPGPALYIVQYRGPVLKEWRAATEAAGGRLYAYLPDFAYLARLDQAALGRVQQLSFVRWVGPYRPEYKFDQLMLSGPDRLELTALVLADVPEDRLAADLAGAGGKLRARSKPAISGRAGSSRSTATLALEAGKGDLAKLAALESVVWLEARPPVRPANDTAAWIVQSGQPNQYPLWQQGLTGAGPAPGAGAALGSEQLVAVADTGMDLGHQDFGGSNYPNATVFGLKNLGANYGNPDPTGTDSSGHGTHVAATVAGSGAASGGETPYNNGSRKGVAYGARLYLQQLGPNLDFINYASSGIPAIADPIYYAMQDARQAGARLQNNSWTAQDSGKYSTLSVQADAFMWDNPDFLAVWAAGNWGPGQVSVGSPATAKNVLTVGSSHNSTSLDLLSSFSGRGPAADGRIKPDLLAPGECLWSAQSGTTGGYTSLCGTSMAAPAATGALALLRDWYANRQGYADPQAALLKATAVNSASYVAGIGGNLADPNQGWGRLTLQNVIGQPAGGFVFADQRQGLQTGEDVYYLFDVSDSARPLKITLAWTDREGLPNASPALVNDLDLQVIAPGNSYSFRGNQFQGQYSVTGGQPDRLNNLEGVTVQSPAKGVWKVRVSGNNVPDGPQPFALALQGAFKCGDGPNVVPSSQTVRVTTTADHTVSNCATGLRQALSTAKSGQQIDLSGLPQGATIYPVSPLPPLKDGVSLQAYCSGGAVGRPDVRLDGSYSWTAAPLGSGLRVEGSSLVRGLAIGNFGGSGLEIVGGSPSLECNWLGTLDGEAAAPNATGLLVGAGAGQVKLGQAGQPLSGNLISGNTEAGLRAEAGSGEVWLNYTLIGFRANATSSLPNSGPGLSVPAGGRVRLEKGNKVNNRPGG